MGTRRTEASRSLRGRSRARVLEARARGQRLVDSWQAAANRQLAALEELAAGALGDEVSPVHSSLTDLCSFWVGCWADAMDLWNETCRTCLHPAIVPGGPIAFEIEQEAEAAEPQVVLGVAFTDAGNLTVQGPLTTRGSGVVIPAGNVRVSTYRSMVLVSLVELGELGLVAGTYSGASLVLRGQTVAAIQVTVT